MLIKIGKLITKVDSRNIGNKIQNVMGLNINKEFMPTVANLNNANISRYKVVNPNYFVFSGMQTGRDETIRIGLNQTSESFVVSPAYTTFIVDDKRILPEYFYMFFLSKERDRLGSFMSDSSVRSNLDWERFCEIEIEVPSIEIQKKYVDVYNSLVFNQNVYECGLDDLKLTIDIFLESIKGKEKIKIGKFLEERTSKNEELRYKFNSVVGVSKDKEIIKTKAKENNNDLSKYIIINKNDFVYNPRSANAIALNLKYNNALISWNNTAFYIKEKYLKALSPRYLNLWFSRDEYSRWAIYNSWGSSTEILSLSDIFDYEIYIPERHIQDAIVKIFDLYYKKSNLNKQLKITLKELSPILIKGATQESKGVI